MYMESRMPGARCLSKLRAWRPAASALEFQATRGPPIQLTAASWQPLPRAPTRASIRGHAPLMSLLEHNPGRVGLSKRDEAAPDPHSAMTAAGGSCRGTGRAGGVH